MTAVPEGAREPSDAELAEAVRAGQIVAYGTLYERHVAAAQPRPPGIEADDLVSEAFARVLDVLRIGRGPDEAFRAYLLTTLRRIAYDRTRHYRRVELAEDVSTVGGVDPRRFASRSTIPPWPRRTVAMPYARKDVFPVFCFVYPRHGRWPLCPLAGVPRC